MTKRIHQDYFKRETAEVAQFVDSLKDNATKGGTSILPPPPISWRRPP